MAHRWPICSSLWPSQDRLGHKAPENWSEHPANCVQLLGLSAEPSGPGSRSRVVPVRTAQESDLKARHSQGQTFPLLSLLECHSQCRPIMPSRPLGPALRLGCIIRIPSPEARPTNSPAWGALSHMPGLCLPSRRMLCLLELCDNLGLGDRGVARCHLPEATCISLSHQAHSLDRDAPPGSLSHLCPQKAPFKWGPQGATCPGPQFPDGCNTYLAERVLNRGRQCGLILGTSRANSYHLSAQIDLDLSRKLVSIGRTPSPTPFWLCGLSAVPPENGLRSYMVVVQALGETILQAGHPLGKTLPQLSLLPCYAQCRQMSLALLLGPNPNPSLGCQSSVHSGLTPKPLGLGTYL